MLSDLKTRMGVKELEFMPEQTVDQNLTVTCPLARLCDCDDPELMCEVYCDLKACRDRDHLIHSLFHEEELREYEADFRISCEAEPYSDGGHDRLMITQGFRNYLAGVISAT
jgi:hypothetical protein